MALRRPSSATLCRSVHAHARTSGHSRLVHCCSAHIELPQWAVSVTLAGSAEVSRGSCAQVEHTIECPRDHVTAVLGLGSSVVSGTAGGTISVHSVASAALQQSLRLPRAAPVSALALPGARESASCMLVSAFSRVHVYALDYGTVVGEFEPHADSITAMSASPGGPGGGVLYTASEDTTIRSWSAGAERSPWSTAAPPLFEADSPEASVPTAVHVRCFLFLICFRCCVRTLASVSSMPYGQEVAGL